MGRDSPRCTGRAFATLTAGLLLDLDHRSVQGGMPVLHRKGQHLPSSREQGRPHFEGKLKEFVLDWLLEDSGRQP